LVRNKNLIMILIFFAYLLIAFLIHRKLGLIANDRYQPYPYIFLIGLTYVPAGIILGYLSNISRKSIRGKWTINLSYLLLMTTPSLYLLFYYWIHYTFLGLPRFLALPLLGARLEPLFGLILGYGIITSFTKVSDDTYNQQERDK
jgi:hypothetical protein